MKVDLTHIKIIHDLASKGATGCREQLAKRLGISIRSLSDLIRYMREELDIPIQYDRLKLTYYCLEDGHVSFKFQRKKDLAKRLINLIESSLVLIFISNAFLFNDLYL